ncbi:hypothetical protein AB6F65_18790 [Providencia hangzhouensis]|uniref:hypothetical protein n=1 Tax=Providencia hangzhouensis TaxID=3031799 RepID=UPI0034DCCF7E
MNQFNLCIEKLKKNRSIKVIKLPDNIIAFYLLSFITIFFKKIILGDIKSVYYQLSIRFVNKRKVIFYDDGFSSILFLKLLKENKSISILNGMQNASFLKKIIFNVFFIKYKNIKINSFVFYSIFLEKSIGKMKKLSLNESITTDIKRNSSIFLGGKYVDIKILSFNDYCEAINKAREISNERLVYIPHRSESPEFLNKLKSNIPTLDINVIESPIEVYLIQHKWIPNDIFSIYSTALFTVGNLFPCSKVYFKKINLNLIPSHYQDSISSLYTFLNSSNRYIAY